MEADSLDDLGRIGRRNNLADARRTLGSGDANGFRGCSHVSSRVTRLAGWRWWRACSAGLFGLYSTGLFRDDFDLPDAALDVQMNGHRCVLVPGVNPLPAAFLKSANVHIADSAHGVGD